MLLCAQVLKLRLQSFSVSGVAKAVAELLLQLGI